MVNELYLQQALELAKNRRGFCAPNPAVGVVLVKHDKVIATGQHWAAGYPHAEVDALNKVGDEARGATLYVTLEPCCHFGKTPPCTQLIIARGIAEVIYGFSDPNPDVAGKGREELLAAGIACRHLPLPEIEVFYASYQHWWRYRTPFVTAKIALSLDGKIAAADGKPITITGPELKVLTHEYRKQSDAILTTVKTIICDNPMLNVRVADEVFAKPVYILDRDLQIPMTSNIWQTAKRLVLFHQASVDVKRLSLLQEQGAVCHAVPAQGQEMDLSAVLQVMGQEGIHDLWVEAGGRCFTSFITKRLLQRALIYIAPLCLGEGAYPAFTDPLPRFSDTANIQWRPYGNDVVCEIREM